MLLYISVAPRLSFFCNRSLESFLLKSAKLNPLFFRCIPEEVSDIFSFPVDLSNRDLLDKLLCRLDFFLGLLYQETDPISFLVPTSEFVAIPILGGGNIDKDFNAL